MQTHVYNVGHKATVATVLPVWKASRFVVANDISNVWCRWGRSEEHASEYNLKRRWRWRIDNTNERANLTDSTTDVTDCSTPAKKAKVS